MKTRIVHEPKWKFEPQPDITAYELAHIVKLLLAQRGKTFEQVEKKIAALPSDGARHFQKTMLVYEEKDTWLYRVLKYLVG